MVTAAVHGMAGQQACFCNVTRVRLCVSHEDVTCHCLESLPIVEERTATSECFVKLCQNFDEAL